jgi:hypothetical protein
MTTKEVNITFLTKHSKPYFHTCKHKPKQIKTAHPNHMDSTFGSENTPRTTTLLFSLIWKVMLLITYYPFKT